jgi:hypothetical protein
MFQLGLWEGFPLVGDSVRSIIERKLILDHIAAEVVALPRCGKALVFVPSPHSGIPIFVWLLNGR